MIVGRVTVSPLTTRWYRVNYGWLPDGVTITNFTATVTAEQNAPDEVDPLFDVTSTEIGAGYTRFRAGGGLEGRIYTVHTAIIASDGQTSDDCITFEIDSGGC
jgi:hypothetical protein